MCICCVFQVLQGLTQTGVQPATTPTALVVNTPPTPSSSSTPVARQLSQAQVRMHSKHTSIKYRLLLRVSHPSVKSRLSFICFKSQLNVSVFF